MRSIDSNTPDAQNNLHGMPAAHFACGRDRCLFTSVMMLGALFGLMASPAARAPMVSIFVVVGVPLMTFAVAAPSRVGTRARRDAPLDRARR